MLEADVIIEGGTCQLGEGPVWDSASSCLWWVDVVRGQLHRFDPKMNTSVSMDLPKRPTSLALTENGLIVVFRRQIGVLNLATFNLDLIDLTDHLGQRERLNDCAVDPDGGLWIGSMDIEQRDPIGAVFCLDLQHGLTRVLNGLVVANGMEWSADGYTFFVVDSAPKTVSAYRIGALSKKVLREYSGEEMPDGMAMDSAGNLWVAIFGGGRIDQLGPDGQLLSSVSVPMPHPTSCALGGEDGCTLFGTSIVDCH